MAKLALVRRAPQTHHRKPSRALAKVKEQLARARKAGRKPPKADFVAPAMSAAAGLAFAYVDAKRPGLSKVKGVPLPLVYGLGAVALGTMVGATARGLTGQILRETGAAGLTLGVYRLASDKLGGGAETTEGDFGDEESAGDYEDD